MTHEQEQSDWETLSESVLTGMHDWRTQHPKATLREIEGEIDLRLASLRARMVHDIALRSAATEWQTLPAGERPSCPVCGTRLVQRGKRARTLHTFGDQHVTLRRSYGVCPTCKRGLFPPR